MNKKMKIGIMVVGIGAIGLYSVFKKSEYDKLMDPIKEIKEKEVLEGKAAPTYEGIVEPSFPDEVENNATLEGVDSNGDGVRDDIEIFINRTAEDANIRKTLKMYYRESISLLMLIDQTREESEVKNKLNEKLSSMFCLSIAADYLDKSYLDKYRKDVDQYKFSQIEILFLNSEKRKKMNSQYENFNIRGLVGADEESNVIYCNSVLGEEVFNKLREQSRAKVAKWKKL